MKETVINRYCDILSEHNGNKVAGASTFEHISVMERDEDNNTYHIATVSLDMCPACAAKYASTLHINYDSRGRKVYTFSNN